MFDTKTIAKRIREARIAKNMTQMNLADAMGVSYQAVSNWERGNSMPDISKLAELCSTLDISAEALLGMEKHSSAVTKLMREEDPVLTHRELEEVAHILPPQQLEEQVKKEKKGYTLDMLGGLAPFLDEDLMAELLEEVEVPDFKSLVALAPFLEEDVMEDLVKRAQTKDWKDLVALMPFLEEDLYAELLTDMEIPDLASIAAVACGLDEDVLDDMVKRAKQLDWQGAVSMAPFLGEETLLYIAEKLDTQPDKHTLERLAPFMDEKGLGYIVDRQVKTGDISNLTGLYPFLDADSVRKILKVMMEQGDMDGMKGAAVFL